MTIFRRGDVDPEEGGVPHRTRVVAIVFGIVAVVLLLLILAILCRIRRPKPASRQQETQLRIQVETLTCVANPKQRSDPGTNSIRSLLGPLREKFQSRSRRNCESMILPIHRPPSALLQPLPDGITTPRTPAYVDIDRVQPEPRMREVPTPLVLTSQHGNYNELPIQSPGDGGLPPYPPPAYSPPSASQTFAFPRRDTLPRYSRIRF